MRSTGSLEACLLLELGRRWALRETVRRRVGWLLLLLARRASELRRLLVRSLLLGRARRLRSELVKVLCTHNSPMSTLSTLPIDFCVRMICPRAHCALKPLCTPRILLSPCSSLNRNVIA